MPQKTASKKIGRPLTKSKNAAVTGTSAPAVDWRRVARTFLVSRALDELEETTLLPQKRILYQFSARVHELGQVLLSMEFTHRRDAASGYYRSHPLLLTLGRTVREALAGGMAKAGGLCDVLDHRVVDGQQTNSFLTEFVKALEFPAYL